MAEIQLKAAPEAASLRGSGAATSAPEEQNSDGVFATLLHDAQNGLPAPIEPDLPARPDTDAIDGEVPLASDHATLPELFPGMALLLPLMTPTALPGRNATVAVATGVAGSRTGTAAADVSTTTLFAATTEAPGGSCAPAGAISTVSLATSLASVNNGPVPGNSAANQGFVIAANPAPATNSETRKTPLAVAASAPPARQVAAGQMREMPSTEHLAGVIPPADALQVAGATLAVNVASGIPTERAPIPVHAEIRAPVTSPAFPEEAAQRINWMVGNGIEHASIRVTPAEMGPIEIRIAMKNDEATINFAVTRPETGAAIENALPRLKEMLESSGISLGNTSVGEEAFAPRHEEPGRDQRERAGSAHAARFGSRLGADDEPALSSTRLSLPGMRLIDLFA